MGENRVTNKEKAAVVGSIVDRIKALQDERKGYLREIDEIRSKSLVFWSIRRRVHNLLMECEIVNAKIDTEFHEIGLIWVS